MKISPMLFLMLVMMFSNEAYCMSRNLNHPDLASVHIVHVGNVKNEEEPMLIKSFPDLDTVPVKRKYIEEYKIYAFDPDYYDLIDKEAATAYYKHHFVGKEISSIIELFNKEKNYPEVKRYFSKFHVGYNQDNNPIISYALGLYITYEEENMDLYAALTWKLLFELDDNKEIVKSVKAFTRLIGP